MGVWRLLSDGAHTAMVAQMLPGALRRTGSLRGLNPGGDAASIRIADMETEENGVDLHCLTRHVLQDLLPTDGGQEERPRADAHHESPGQAAHQRLSALCAMKTP